MIVGAGAIGGGIGARLVQAGLPTVLIARGEHLAAHAAGRSAAADAAEDVTLPVTAVGSVRTGAPAPTT